jgi:hypothetical protein
MRLARSATTRATRAALVLAAALLAGGCAARTAPQPAPAARLAPQTLVYAYTVRGAPAGGATYTLTRQDGAWRHFSDVRYGEGPGAPRFRTEILFGDGWEPLLNVDTGPGASPAVTRWRYRDGRMTGERTRGGAAAPDTVYDVAVPEGTVFDLMDEHVLRLADLRPGATLALPVLVTRAPRRVTYTVTGEDTLVVPAGTFPVYRVEVRGKPGVSEEPDVLQVWHLTRSAPHQVVRQELPSLGLVGELTEVRSGGS